LSDFGPAGSTTDIWECPDLFPLSVEDKRGEQAWALIVDGFRGHGLVNTFRDGDQSEGALTSPQFEITHGHLSFLIGGGNHAGRTCMNLIVNDAIVRTATGDAAERLVWKSWDVRELRGRKARLEIVDRHTGGSGHINVDHVVLPDAPARPSTEPALWVDWGKDFSQTGVALGVVCQLARVALCR
jgi:sucrose-6-phosphate hydrolase SacC (GH32 family)